VNRQIQSNRSFTNNPMQSYQHLGGKPHQYISNADSNQVNNQIQQKLNYYNGSRDPNLADNSNYI